MPCWQAINCEGYARRTAIDTECLEQALAVCFQITDNRDSDVRKAS